MQVKKNWQKQGFDAHKRVKKQNHSHTRMNQRIILVYGNSGLFVALAVIPIGYNE